MEFDKVVEDIIGIVAIAVAIMAWRWPRAPRRIEGNVDIDDDSLSSEKDAPAEHDTPEPAVPEMIEIPFPPGLLIQEYEPNQRLRIRENKPVVFSFHSIIPQLFVSIIFFCCLR